MSDSCGACETGGSDHYGDESGCMRKTDRSVLAIRPEIQSGSLLYTRRKRIPAVEFFNL